MGSGFSFPNGIYTVQDEVNLVYENSSYKLEQEACQKTKLTLSKYEKFPEEYELIYKNPNCPKLGMSQKLDVKYIYNMMAVAGAHRVENKLKRGFSDATQKRFAYEERKRTLEIERDKKLQKFERRADNFERFQNDSFYTNEERYYRGRMDRSDYYDGVLMRDYWRGDISRPYDNAIYGERMMLERDEKEMRTQRREGIYVSANQKLRYVKVGELVLLEGQLLAVAAYKTPQEVNQIECMDAMEMDHLEGRVYAHDVMMETEIDYEAVRQFFA